MLLRSGARALATSSTAEAERHLQGDLSLLWTFLQEEGWCFATNSWDVCPPLTNKEPCVLGEGFGSRAFPQAQLPSYLVKHPELLARYHQWRERMYRDGEGERVKGGSDQSLSNWGRDSHSYNLCRTACRVPPPTSRTAATRLYRETSSAAWDDGHRQEKCRKPQRQEQQHRKQPKQKQNLEEQPQEKQQPQEQLRGLGFNDTAVIDIPFSSDTGEQCEIPRSHRGEKSKQPATSLCILRRSTRQASSRQLSQPSPVALQEKQPSSPGSKDTTAVDVPLPDSSDMGKKQRGGNASRSHRGRSAKQSAKRSCVLQRSTRGAPSRSTSMPQLTQSPPAMLDYQRLKRNGKKRKIHVGNGKGCSSVSGTGSAKDVMRRACEEHQVDKGGSGGGDNEGSNRTDKRIKTEPKGRSSTSSRPSGVAAISAGAQEQVGGAGGDISRATPLQSQREVSGSDPVSTLEYACGRGAAGGVGGDDVGDMLAPYDRIATETVDDKGLEELLHNGQRGGYLDLRKYREPGWPRPLRVTRLEASHGKRFEDHLLRLLKENRRVEATVFLRRLAHFDLHPPEFAAAAMDALGRGRGSTMCIPAWYQEIAGISGDIAEVVDATASDMEVIECLDEPLDSVEGLRREREHGGSSEGTSSGSVSALPFIKKEI